MKLSKCLIFKIKDQRFAVKTQNVIDFIEKVYLVSNPDSEEMCHKAFSFKNKNIPFIDFHHLLGIREEQEETATNVLILDLNINNRNKLLGISVDEILEISELDDFLSYPYMPLVNNRPFDFREAIIIHNNQPVIILNTHKVWANQIKKEMIFHTGNYPN